MQTTLERELLKQGILTSHGSQKEASRIYGLTESMLSKIFSGEREIAPDVKCIMSARSVKAGFAIAIEGTGYKAIFNMEVRDSHPQTLLRRIEIEDGHSDAARKRIGERLVDKFEDGDLTAEEIADTRADIRELLDEIGVAIRLIAELDGKYPSLRVPEILQEKEKSRQ